ncbi:site-2 protease family protein [Clostridium fallax]|uniref:Stage IV sporulation protein FB n=1 Tax=Clostridium fallax TaxID=1533 RepID=A0A1M4VAB7_9CLOT|nr:site-2 protease family protein [Clostridium fallax]SHE65946.1 stage IV sporulation protein FB [Clostridium fallax]SQB05813.1 sterol-regulatory element binding protein [Clostridium fallax]
MIKISKWLIPQIFIFFILGFKSVIFIAFFWIILHELCHCFVSIILGANIENFKLGPLGVSLELKDLDEMGCNKEILICMVGPLFNIMMAILFYFLNLKINSYILQINFEINLSLGLFNLLPAYPLDGFRIVRSYLGKKILYKRAHDITIYISYICGIFLMGLFFLYGFLHRLNISLLFCSIFILYLTYKEKGRIMYIIMGDIFKKKKRFYKNKWLENKTISVHYKEGLAKVFSLVDKNKFNLFIVLDDDMKVLGQIYEDKIIDGLKKYGNISLEEYISINKQIT